MSNILKKIVVGFIVCSLSFLSLGLICFAVGIRVNTTKSIPLGFYHTSGMPIEREAYVLFCPPKSDVFDEAKRRGYIGAGFCPGGYGYMMKKVLAMEDDLIGITKEGVRVNGKLLPLSGPVKTDQAGREMPHYKETQFSLDSSEVLLMSDVSATSFDARYFGPIHRSQIQSVISPIFTW